MPDLNDMRLKDEVLDIDYDSAVEPSEFPPPPEEGMYTLIQGKPVISLNDDGSLYRINFAEGHKLADDSAKSVARFDSLYPTAFSRQQGPKLPYFLIDQCRAIGDTNRYRTTGEFITAIQAGEGKPFKAKLTWEGYCGHKNTPQEVADSKQGFTVKGARNFPPLANGSSGHMDSMPCPICGQDIRARERVNLRLPA